MNGNACLDHLFVEMFLHTRRMHMVSLRYGYARDFSMHQIDGNAFHRCDIRIDVHYDELSDADSKLNQSKKSCDSRNTCKVVRRYDIYEYGHSNPDGS